MLIPFLLSTLAVAQVGPAHAELHPIESDLYLELGDVSHLLSELEKAPLVRFLRDERVASVMAGFGHRVDRPLRELAGEELAHVLPGAKTGGWLDGLRACSVSVVARGAATDGSAPGAFLAVLDFATPEHAAALRTALIESAPEHEPVESVLPGVEALRQTGAPAEERWCVVVGSRLLLGGKDSSLEDYLARAEKKRAGLAGSESFRAQLAALGQASGTPVLWFALARPLREIVSEMPSAAGLGFVSQLPEELDPFGSACVARMQFVGERFVTDVVAKSSGGEAPPVDPAWLAAVPAGSMLVYASAFDGAAAGRRLRELLARDEASAAALTALERGLGFGPERVLARLGPAMTVYSPPLAGLALPEVRLWIDCDDPSAFAAEFVSVFGALESQGFQAKTRPYTVKKGDQKIEVPYTTLALPPSWQVIPMINPTPTFAAVGKKLVFTLSSMEMKSELKRVHGAAGEGSAPGSDPLAALGFQLPGGARSVLVMDWGGLLGSIIQTAKTMGPLLGDELPVDLSKLPPPELFTQYFKPTFHYSKASANGLFRHNEASFGPETWFPLLQGTLQAARSFDRAEAARQRAFEAEVEARESRETPGGGQ